MGERFAEPGERIDAVELGAEFKIRMLAIEDVDLSPPPPAQQGFGF